jgi:hypothetical protein
MRPTQQDRWWLSSGAPGIVVMPQKTLDNPQRRRQIERLVHNEFPNCEVEFVAAPRDSLAFRVRAMNGRNRSGVIKLLAHHGHIRLNRAWLAAQLRAHGGPAAA